MQELQNTLHPSMVMLQLMLWKCISGIYLCWKYLETSDFMRHYIVKSVKMMGIILLQSTVRWSYSSKSVKAWPVWHPTYGQSHTVFGQYQIILLGDRGTCVYKKVVMRQWMAAHQTHKSDTSAMTKRFHKETSQTCDNQRTRNSSGDEIAKRDFSVYLFILLRIYSISALNK